MAVVLADIKISMAKVGPPNQEELQKFVDEKIEHSVVDSLKKYIEIENVTHDFYNDDDWSKDKDPNDPDSKEGGYNLIAQAGRHIAKWVEELGVVGAKVSFLQLHDVEGKVDKKRTPIILTEIEASGAGDNVDETFLFYGHFDKQPPMDEISKWTVTTPYVPFPVEENGQTVKLYGRGGADDGYSTYSTMVAIKALQEQKIPLPRIVMITEGDEESGRGDVEAWIEDLGARLGTPRLIFCLDSGTLDYDRFWLTNSLRGYLVVMFRVRVLNEAVHSGSGSGIIPTCFRIIRKLLDRIESIETGEMPKFDYKIPDNRIQEVNNLVTILQEKSITQYKTVPGLQTPLPGYADTILLNTWRAQLETLAIDGYPPTDKSSNIINPTVKVKLSIRLPPNLEHKKAEEIADQWLFHDPPYNCEISEKFLASDNGFDAPENPKQLLDVFEAASQAVFQQPHLSMGQGGSIPFMNFLRKRWPQAKFVITGLLGPESNAHGPDECLRVDYLKKLTACFAQIIARAVPLYFEYKEPKVKGHHHHGHGHSHSHSHSKSHGKQNNHGKGNKGKGGHHH